MGTQIFSAVVHFVEAMTFLYFLSTILKRVTELGEYLVRQNRINNHLIEMQEVNNRLFEVSDSRIKKLESLI